MLTSTPERRLLLLAVVTRVLPAALIYGTEDVASWYRCGELVAGGSSPYDSRYLISWPPLWAGFAAFAYVAADATAIPFSFLVKLFPIAADIILTFLLYSLATRYGQPAYATAVAYALNPISIYTSAVHGNFDSIPTLCLFMAVVFADRPEDDPAGKRSGLWLGIGGAFKTWPLLILPGLMTGAQPWRRRFVIAALAIGVFLAALLLPMPFVGRAAIAYVLQYRGGYPGWWGFGSIALLNGFEPSLTAIRWIFYAAMAAAALLVFIGRTSALQGALFCLLTFYVSAPGFGLQYLVWIVPIVLLADRRRALMYTALGTALILFELIARPYTGHPFDSIRFLPHADFARSWGNATDRLYTAGARIVLWAFFVAWWFASLRTVTRRESASPRQ